MKQIGDRLLVPIVVLVIWVPKESIMVIPTFKMEGNGIKGIVNVCRMPEVHVIVALMKKGERMIQIFSANVEVKLVGKKAALASVLMSPEAQVEWDKDVVEEVSIGVH